MRILHFCMQAPFTEGYSYQDNLLTEYQHKHGHDVRIVTTTKTRGADGRYRYTVPCRTRLDNGVELIRIEVKSRIRNAVGIYPGILREMKDYHPDLVFIHGLCSFIPAAAIKYKKAYAPSVHIVADNHQDEGTTRFDDLLSSGLLFLHKQGWKRWIREVDKVYGTTGWRMTVARQYYGIPNEKLDLLVMGIDSDRLPDIDKTRRAYREKYRIGEDDFLFITGGKLDRKKKTIEAMKAFISINHPKAKFLVFGSLDDDIKEEFTQLCKSDNRIIYIGFIPSSEVMNLFCASDFGVFPNHHSVLWEEAIGCSLPCMFRRYEEKDHTEVCGNCVCIEDAQPETIRTVMEKVFTDKEYYLRLKKNAEKAADRFSYHTIADKSVECCYEE